MTTNKSPPRSVRVLTRLRISEVSAVDRGAGEGCRVVLSKRDDSDYSNTELSVEERAHAKMIGRMALRDAEDMYTKQDGTGHADHKPEDDEDENPYKKFFVGMKVSESAARAMAKVAAELNKGNDADDANDGLKRDGREAIADIVEDVLDQDADGKPTADGGNDHPAQRAADLLVEAGKFSTRAEALDYFLHNPRGAAMLRRLHKSEDTTIMNPTDKLRDIAKRYGIGAIAKSIVEDDHAYSINEHELTDLVIECAKRDHPGLSDAQAFTKVFTDQSEAGTMLRKAFAVVKSAARVDGAYPFPKF